MNKQTKIVDLICSLASGFNNLPKKYVNEAINTYINDNRKYEVIKKEIMMYYEQLKRWDDFCSSDISQDILDKSILIIGPMCCGKSAISDRLEKITLFPKIDLDDCIKLASLYAQRGNYSYFKDFEFFLTTNVLTNLSAPTIVSFGAGHSIYDTVIERYCIEKLCHRFKHVILLLPSYDNEVSLRVLEERLLLREGHIDDKMLQENTYFMKNNTNKLLCTNVVTTENKSLDDIANEILGIVNNTTI